MHTGYFNILRRSGAGQKETTSENQRFSEVFYGLMDPLVIREYFVLLAYIFDYQVVITPVYVSMYHSVYHIWYVDEDKITPDFGPVKAISPFLIIISRMSPN